MKESIRVNIVVIKHPCVSTFCGAGAAGMTSGSDENIIY